MFDEFSDTSDDKLALYVHESTIHYMTIRLILPIPEVFAECFPGLATCGTQHPCRAMQ